MPMLAKVDEFVAKHLPNAQAVSTADSLDEAREVFRSEERRVGKECQSVCRSRWSPYH